ncbi:T9SS type A sorting domain-containing protein [Pleomorphovibrio marinus]|uniref:T9SS type A sorting domain-containing protein n=1 Tax=Pleomorphovibrio marinus TaxID=2164132 RepID=UPI000E0AF614|nr:T9SS type A sorting domain-containing protein [Pleomorphovibrio marinus]
MNLRGFLLFTALFLYHLSAAQQIGRVEYFFDKEPGFGEGTPINIHPEASVNLDESIALQGLEPGMHQFFIRIQNEEGSWSMTQSRAFFVAPKPALSRELLSLEYYFNEDPGFGKGSKIPISEDDLVTIDLHVPLNGLTPGFHQLFIRALDSEGSWSMSNSRVFYLQPLESGIKNLRVLEYFIDEDPGFGNGSVIPITTSSTLVLDVTASLQENSLSPGFYIFYLRAKDEQGNWSLTQRRAFYLQEGTLELSPITHFEYHLEAEDYHSGSKIFEVDPAPFVELDFQADLSFLPEINRTYQFYLYAVNENGVRSMVEQREISICSGDPPKADFEYQLLENRIQLKSISTSADSLQWIFGSEAFYGDEIEISTPAPGGYEVLLIAGNLCGKDTLQTSIVLPGILSVHPNTASIQQSEAIFRVEMLGIENLEQIFLKNESGEELLPLETIQVDSLFYQVKFDFTQVGPGNYHLQVQAEKSFTYAQDIQIFEGGNFPFGEWVSFEIPPGETFLAKVLVPELEKIQVFLKKADRFGYSGTWSGELKLRQGEETLGIRRGSTDYDMELSRVQPGIYHLEVQNHSRLPVTGQLMVSDSPEWLPLNRWEKGEILRPYGNDWKFIDLKPDIDTLFFQTEGYGMWSTLEVFYQQMEKPSSQWRFSRMGSGYALSGHIPNPAPGRYFLRYMDSAVLRHTPDEDQRRDYLIYAGTVASLSHPEGNQEILQLSNYETGQGQSSFQIQGLGFTEADSLALMSLSDSSMIGLNSRWVNGGLLEFTHDFRDLPPGEYQVGIVGNPSIFHHVPIEVIGASDQNLSVEIIGREQLRIGRFQKYVLRVKNMGTVDKNFISINIGGIPSIATIRLDGEIHSLSEITNYDSLINTETVDETKFIPLLINNLPSSDHVDIPFSIYLPSMVDFDLEVTLDMEFEKKWDFFASESFKTYMQEMATIDSLLEALVEINLSMMSARRKDMVTDAYQATYAALSSAVNRQLGSPISQDCSAALGKAGGSIAARSLRAYLNNNEASFSPGILTSLLSDWGDCLGSTANTLKGNIWDPIQNNKQRGIWNTTKSVVFQWDLYYNLFSNSMTCLNAFANTPINPAGGIRFFARNLASRKSRAFHLATLGRTTTQRRIAQAIEPLRKYQQFGDKVAAFVGTVNEVLDVGVSLYDGCNQDYRDRQMSLASISSVTPEDKFGPVGFDQEPGLSLGEKQRFIADGDLFAYKIDYWNKEDATAPAAEVFIRDTLDTNFDIHSVNFTEIGFLKWTLPLDGGQYFDVTVDMRPDKNLLVQVRGTVDHDTREIYWVHRSLDPNTMELPDDPMAGYLPPIDSTGYHIGWVNFTVKPLDSLDHNTVFQNQAHVNFDGVGPWGPAPPYGPYTNTLDLYPPVSQVNTLPNRLPPTFDVSWGGEDIGSGIANYDIFVAKNGGDYEKWLTAHADTTYLYEGEENSNYAFYSIAKDHTGNIEQKSDTLEAWTFVPPLPPTPEPQFPTGPVVKADKFYWPSTYEADGYRIQVARDSLFQSITLDEYVIDTLFHGYAAADDAIYYWRVLAYNVTGDSEWSIPLSFTVDPVTGLQKVSSNIPDRFYLGTPYPNPSKGSFQMEIHIAKTTQIMLNIVSATGQTSSLLLNQPLDPGVYLMEIQLPPSAAGLYFCNMNSQHFQDTKKIWVIK